MGIDIYAKWKNQSEDERREQASAWLRIDAGGLGYLREAYHGAPYPAKHLCAEAFEGGPAMIPAAILHDRLPHTLALVEERERNVYRATDKEVEEAKQSYRDFVALCQTKERQTGEPVLVIASY